MPVTTFDVVRVEYSSDYEGLRIETPILSTGDVLKATAVALANAYSVVGGQCAGVKVYLIEDGVINEGLSRMFRSVFELRSILFEVVVKLHHGKTAAEAWKEVL